MGKRILVLHGPNLNLLGQRQGDKERITLEELNRILTDEASKLAVELKITQSNHEGHLVDALQVERHWADGILVSPAALAHGSYVLRDTLLALDKPAIEVHLSDLGRRQSWRRKSVIKEACDAQIIGHGIDSYLIALRRLAGGDKPTQAGRSTRASRSPARATEPAARSPKTIGRKPGAAEPVPPSPPSTSSGNGFSRRDRRAAASAPVQPAVTKTLGRVPPSLQIPGAELLTRALVRQKIAERLSGKLSPAGLATWARRQWLEVQRGAPAESGQRELLEDCLQSLVLSTLPASKLSDDQLIDLMAQLEG